MSLHPLVPAKHPRPRAIRALLALLAFCSVALASTHRAQAQAQESGLLNRIDHPDRTLAFPLTNKLFGKTSAYKNKEAYVKPFAYGKSASIADDGKFRTNSFVSSTYRSKDFGFRDNSPGKKDFGQTNKLFDTKSVDVRDARDASKTLAVRSFGTGNSFSVRGKRQDTYDEMLKRKKLSIEEVRELLNKNKYS